MKDYPDPLDLTKLKAYPLCQRESLSTIDKLIVDPNQSPQPCDPHALQFIQECAKNIVAARRQGAGVMLLYGAHLIKNGAMSIVNQLVEGGWVNHLATNGAGTIHDWE